MSRIGLGYTVGTAAAGAVVAAVGILAVGMAAAKAVLFGVGVGVVVQVGLFWGLFVFAMPDKPAIAHLLGMLIRFMTVALAALIGVAIAEVSPAPALFSLVACLFVSTLLEAYFVKRQSTLTLA